MKTMKNIENGDILAGAREWEKRCEHKRNIEDLPEDLQWELYLDDCYGTIRELVKVPELNAAIRMILKPDFMEWREE